MKRVVIATQTEDESLFWGSLFLHDPIGFAIFGNRLALGRTGNDFGEFFTSGFGS